MAQLVKNLPAMQETWVQSLGWEDLLEKGMTDGWTASLTQWTSLSTLCDMGKDREAWHAAVHEVAKGQTQLSD